MRGSEAGGGHLSRNSEGALKGKGYRGGGKGRGMGGRGEGDFLFKSSSILKNDNRKMRHHCIVNYSRHCDALIAKTIRAVFIYLF